MGPMTPSSLLLAVDPGTIVTGLAIFRDGKPWYTGIIEADRKMPVDKRISQIMSRFEAFLELSLRMPTAQRITAVACEQWRGPRNPYLQTLITSMGQHVRSQKLEWHLYNNSMVTASVAPRGFRVTAKERKRQGVLALYPSHGWDMVSEDEIDAIAVGHYHLAQQREAALLGATTLNTR